MNSEVGNIQTQNVKFKHAKVDNENGNILMKNLQSGISLDAKNEDGDIELYCKEDPHNTLLQTKNEDGETIITNRALKHIKAGKGQHLVKLSNDSGDIKVK
ncbi:DUF4097 family beta strand repeat-containing protein [Staphylococcus saccharolyticus]|uniref:DUF4097 family beta strand repeat-containing protein n=1 Tax=Staphylococcus saccharolyticus TaxID=33028 RepID=UPI0023AF88F3|nr:DUF4097 family beta strand repeat-containing protein [Staphylococcus saccharolyticus]